MEWISVENRLPKTSIAIDHYISDPVICYFKSGLVESCQLYVSILDGDISWVFCGDGEDAEKEEISHWMPLQEPANE